MEDLLEKIKDGDETAYEKMVNLIYKDLYYIAKMRLNNEDDANDAVQETLIKFYANFSTIKNPKCLKSWLIKILINECNNIYEFRKRKFELIEKLQNNVEIQMSDLDKIEEKFMNGELFKNLSDKEKRILNLYYEDDYKTSTIGQLLNMNENTVKSHIHRAKEKVGEEIKIRKKISNITIMLIAIIIISSTMTFAGRVMRTLKETIVMFQVTSTTGVDDAIQNGYVQKCNEDFSYNNDIGIKIDNITIDDKLIYISYILDVKKEIDDIRIEDYSIYDDKNRVLSVELNSNIKNIYGSDYSSGGITYSTKSVKNENGTWNYSTVFQVIYDKDYPLSNAINMEINSISILSNNHREIISGNWKLTANLDSKFTQRKSEYYKCEANEKIKDISAKLNDMSFELEIDFNEDINEDVLSTNNIILQDENGETVKCLLKVVNVHKDKVIYICDIGKYSENIDTLNLYIKYDYGSDKYVDMILKK